MLVSAKLASVRLVMQVVSFLGGLFAFGKQINATTTYTGLDQRAVSDRGVLGVKICIRLGLIGLLAVWGLVF